MTNADKFKNIFGLYATELWSMPEKDFLKWLNSEAMNCSEFPNNSDTIRCKDCKHWDGVDTCDVIDAPVWDNDFCSMAERRTDE